MTAISNTITTGQDVDLYNAIAAALSANGYTLVDTQVISTRTHKVWKNPAANNASGKDWYFDIAYSTTGAQRVWVLPFEDYDTVNHLGIRGLMDNSQGVALEQTNYSVTGATGYALENSAWRCSPVGASDPTLGFLTGASSYGYWIDVTKDYIAGFTSNSATTVLYSGLCTPTAAHTAAAGASVLPLCTVNLIPAGANAVRPTRMPKLTAQPGGSGINPSYYATPIYGGPRVPSGSQLGVQQTAQPVIVSSGGTSSLLQALQGDLKGVICVNADPTVNRGDTVQIGTDTYWLTAPNSNVSLGVKQA